MFDIKFNNLTSRELGIAVTTRPSIPSPVARGEFIDIAGRNGSLLVTDDTYENITIDVAMNIVRKPTEWMKAYREAKSWIMGGGELSMSDDNDAYYKVKASSITSTERIAKVGGHIVASFICDPFTYFKEGAVPLDVSQIGVNPYMECHPIYKITGEGDMELTVNGNTMTGTVGQNLTIDTDLMMAYREDGEVVNSSVRGDYRSLWMPHGPNNVSITQGFGLKVIPNWRTL